MHTQRDIHVPLAQKLSVEQVRVKQVTATDRLLCSKGTSIPKGLKAHACISAVLEFWRVALSLGTGRDGE